MADSGAVRQARHKRHQQGDHSMCRAGCGRRVLAPVPADVQAAFPVTSAAGDVLDPVVEMRALAVRLAGACSQDPSNAALARELRATLLALAGLAPAVSEDDRAWADFLGSLGPDVAPS
jgi:hypothetical protein